MERIDSLREYRLDNGLYIALQKTPTKNIESHLEVNLGTVHEEEGQKGIVHFLEHVLVTGGTEKFSPEKVLDIKSYLGSFNAHTSIESTRFEGGFMVEDLELYLDMISSSVFNPLFQVEKVEEERRRILREITDSMTSSAP
ncbi:hypothetical protein COU57_06295 [Candidatus Pacearchaeota archaeon CG10_big_fil_rev_8_21_14_0_10_32_14]|nr:MAG: hypothetical protein COU57_06295 [Candidatus Pacearchaeota archaeon CG10_big_fil_rev_8_21_14_0_10_32_14]